MEQVKTYNCKQVYIMLGDHIVTGYAEDSFISYEPAGDGVTAISGCDGEISRAVDPNSLYTVKLVVQQTSATNQWLQDKYAQDRSTGDGLFSIEIKDKRGVSQFTGTAWVAKPSAKTYGKATNSREWNMYAGDVTVSEGDYSTQTVSG